MPQSDLKLEVGKTSCSLTGINSNTYTPQLLCWMELNSSSALVPHSLEDICSQTSVNASTLPMVAPIVFLSVVTATSVQDANSVAMLNLIATWEKEKLARNLQPKYLHYNTWVIRHFFLCTADWTMIATPLPSISLNKHDNPITNNTILCNPSLFEIITPINVNLFKSLLSTHPNQPFIALVCKGLREGYWPWADTSLNSFPVTHNTLMSLPQALPSGNAIFPYHRTDYLLQTCI